MNLLLIIPAHNEADNLITLIPHIIETCPQYDYVIINDGSTDNTETMCKERGYNYITLPVNLGIGGAVQTGYRYACELGKENKYRNTESVFSDIYLLYIVVGSVLFVVLLCFSYNLMFSDSQAREATAAARYVLPCDYMLVFLLLFLMLSECRDELLGRVIIVWLGFSLLFVNYKSLFGNLLNGNQEKTHSGIETASVRIQPCDRIFYVNQVSEKFKYSGYEFNLYIMPGVSNTSNYTLYDNDDMENGERINMGSLNAILLEGDYDYVYLDSIYILDDFIDEYGNLFADTSQIHGDELYKVEVDNKGSVVLYNM